MREQLTVTALLTSWCPCRVHEGMPSASPPCSSATTSCTTVSTPWAATTATTPTTGRRIPLAGDDPAAGSAAAPTAGCRSAALPAPLPAPHSAPAMLPGEYRLCALLQPGACRTTSGQDADAAEYWRQQNRHLHVVSISFLIRQHPDVSFVPEVFRGRQVLWARSLRAWWRVQGPCATAAPAVDPSCPGRLRG